MFARRLCKIPRLLQQSTYYSRTLSNSTTTTPGLPSALPAGTTTEECLKADAASPTKSGALVAGLKSIRVPLKAGDGVWWCACGRSSKQPFCDGAHKVCDILPMKFTATEDKTYAFCTCKLTNKPPLCDGSHKTLNQTPPPVTSAPASASATTTHS